MPGSSCVLCLCTWRWPIISAPPRPRGISSRICLGLPPTQVCLSQGWGLQGAGDAAQITACPQRCPSHRGCTSSLKQGPVTVTTHPCRAEIVTQHHLSTRAAGPCLHTPQLAADPMPRKGGARIRPLPTAVPLYRAVPRRRGRVQSGDRGCKLSGPVKHLMILNLSASINT